MPSIGEYQAPAGVDKGCTVNCSCPSCKPLGTRAMVSRDATIRTNLKIDNVPYKGNPVLNAQRV